MQRCGSIALGISSYRSFLISFYFVSCTSGNYIQRSLIFTIGGYTFEVGGKNKSQKQVHDVENAYIVKDDIEYGMRNVIPLWTFGFLY